MINVRIKYAINGARRMVLVPRCRIELAIFMSWVSTAMLRIVESTDWLLCCRAFIKAHTRRNFKCIFSFQFTFINLNATPGTLRAQPRNQVLIKAVNISVLLLRYKHEIFSLNVVHSHIASLFALLEPGARLIPHLLKPRHIHQHRLCILHHLRPPTAVPSFSLILNMMCIASSTLNSPDAVTFW